MKNNNSWMKIIWFFKKKNAFAQKNKKIEDYMHTTQTSQHSKLLGVTKRPLILIKRNFLKKLDIYNAYASTCHNYVYHWMVAISFTLKILWSYIITFMLVKTFYGFSGIFSLLRMVAKIRFLNNIVIYHLHRTISSTHQSPSLTSYPKKYIIIFNLFILYKKKKFFSYSFFFVRINLH